MGFVCGSFASITRVALWAITSRTAEHAIGSSHVVYAIHTRTTDARVIPSCSCARYGWVCGSVTSITRPSCLIQTITWCSASLILIDMCGVSSSITLNGCTVPCSLSLTTGPHPISFALATTTNTTISITAHGCCMTVAIHSSCTSIMVSPTAWSTVAWFTRASALTWVVY